MGSTGGHGGEPAAGRFHPSETPAPDGAVEPHPARVCLFARVYGAEPFLGREGTPRPPVALTPALDRTVHAHSTCARRRTTSAIGDQGTEPSRGQYELLRKNQVPAFDRSARPDPA